ncbi:hypothetical protein [Owenweeksia hongkongensis]|uniref:hypothetical protein n=1 Tax=Owenweeksia hongkongensis TaxID=253245 RepID=UPI003A952475
MTSNLKSISTFIVAFITFTVIGTLSHEYGHIAAAKFLGYETTLHYGSMNYDRAGSVNGKRLQEIRSSFQYEIENNLPFSYKIEYNELIAKNRSDRLWIRIGGPLQTMLTGTIGFIILLYRKQKIHTSGMTLFDWIAVLLALFWLRQVFNLCIGLVKGLLGRVSFFGGDEAHISYWLNLPVGTFSIVTGVVGLGICSYTIFRIIPRSHHFNFILGGLLGGIIGFILWMKIVGSLILP